MPGWYKACEIGRSEQQVPPVTFVTFGVQGRLLASLFLWSSFAVSADWEALAVLTL